MCQPQQDGEQSQPTPSNTNPDIPPAVLSRIPSHPSCAEALSTARSLLPASILHHSLRVYLYALHLLDSAEGRDLLLSPHPCSSPLVASAARPVTREVLFASCVLHDLGASASSPVSPPSPLRFETVGADAVAALLARHHHHDPASPHGAAAAREAWLAVALHTSPHLAEGAGGLVRAVRLAVRADFGAGPLRDAVGRGFAARAEALLPRLGVERELGNAVVARAREVRSRAPGGSWPGDLLRAAEAEPEWEGVNRAF